MRLAAALALVILATAAQAADRRVSVDPNEPPWNAIAKVQTNIGGRCTGALIAPTVVLTAAHCLYNRRTRALVLRWSFAPSHRSSVPKPEHRA